MEDFENGIKRGLIIEFNLEHYDEAFQLLKYFREMEANVGSMVLEFLRSEKNKV